MGALIPPPQVRKMPYAARDATNQSWTPDAAWPGP